MRPSGRRADELRAVTIETGVTRHAEGSVLIRAGDTSWTDIAVDLDVCMMRGVDKGVVVRLKGDAGLGVDLRGGGYQDVLMYQREWPMGRARAMNANGTWNLVVSDLAGADVGNLTRFDVNIFDCGGGTTYCVAKVNSLGCTPSLTATGVPSELVSAVASVEGVAHAAAALEITTTFERDFIPSISVNN